ncbi:uncharacterized protein LOC135103753 [Scylla paramamosain]|uniref:uncharacterized protein LOC135103753 n=1 Tax=Scylla paramamosain TaxID=85552 RepID=UPI0030839CB2
MLPSTVPFRRLKSKQHLEMAFLNLRVVVVLLAVAVVTVEPTLRRRQRCHPQVKYVTQYETQYQEVPVEKVVYRTKVVPTTVYQTQVKTQVQQKYVTVTKTQQSYRTVCPKPSYGGYGGR